MRARSYVPKYVRQHYFALFGWKEAELRKLGHVLRDVLGDVLGDFLRLIQDSYMVGLRLIPH